MGQGIKKISENVIEEGRALTITSENVPDSIAIPTGTLKLNKSLKGLEWKVSNNNYSKFNATGLLIAGSITEELLANDSVTTNKIKNLNVITNKLADYSVTNIKIDNAAINEDKLASNSVTTSKIKDLSIVESKLADNSVTTNKIKNLNIVSDKIGDSQIITRTISNYAVNESKLATDSVTEVKIKNNSISNSKFKSGAIYGPAIANNAIETQHYKDDSITSVKIADGSVINSKLGDKQVTSNKIADNSIANIHLQNNAITTNKLTDLSVTTSKVANKSITKEKLASDVISSIDNAVMYESDNSVKLRAGISVNGDINATGNITGSRVYNMSYMDIAEGYVPGMLYLEAGDIVELREDGKVYKATAMNHNATIVGVISDEYAACYGATPEELKNYTKVAVGLIGKVHVNIVGEVKIGDTITIAYDGIGTTMNNVFGCDIIGKSLETNTTKHEKKVCCLIFPSIR